MDTTDKHEDRVALLEQAVKRETDFLRIVEARFNAGTGTDADVRRARSYLLDSKIRLLRERGPNDKVATQIKALQKEQIDALTQLVKLVEDEYRKGATEFGPLLSAEIALFNAQVDATDNHEGRIAALEEGVKRGTDFVKIADARYNAGTVTVAEVSQARSHLLDSQIRLLRESAAEYIQRGNELENQGEYDKAIADYNQALAINPKYAVAYTNRGVARYSKGDYDKAIADYTQALAINPWNPTSKESLGGKS
jgi:tetratricopeptide (TPR) repeat protein